jgi:hypothetical protein
METAREILNLIKEISPEIWSILIKQIYFEAMAKFLWGTAIVLSGYISYKKL